MNWKVIVASVLGIITTFIIVVGVESINKTLYPAVFEQIPKDLSESKAFISQIPVLAFIVIALAHFLGLLMGGFLSFIVYKKDKTAFLIVAGTFSVMTLINLFIIPHPMWFVIVDLAAIVFAIVLLLIRLKWGTVSSQTSSKSDINQTEKLKGENEI
jgi:hypothetical protein